MYWKYMIICNKSTKIYVQVDKWALNAYFDHGEDFSQLNCLTAHNEYSI